MTLELKHNVALDAATPASVAETAALQVATSADGYVSKETIFEQRVTSVTHYTDRLFSFRITRPASFRFRSGQFVMIGLPNAAAPVLRAYSIASPSWDEEIEFFSIKVPHGALTQHLQRIAVGDTVLMKKKPTGTLVNDALLPGRRLFMLSTGTGIAPFASLIRDPETYEKFDQIILTQTCREVAELTYGTERVAAARVDPLVGDEATAERLLHITTATREPHLHTKRITTMLCDGSLFDVTGGDTIDPENDRVMICGSMEMLKQTRQICEDLGLEEGRNNKPATYVVERAFVD